MVGDFNIILGAEEKYGGLPYSLNNSLEFMNCIDDYGLQDAGYYGAKFTWCDNRGPNNTIWKRLDRLLINSEWSERIHETLVMYLARVCFDYAPLLINTKITSNHNGPSYFKFLNFWVDYKDFIYVVQEVCQEPVIGNAMWILHQKLKKVCHRLSSWSREAFGDIYEEPKRLEKQISNLEDD